MQERTHMSNTVFCSDAEQHRPRSGRVVQPWKKDPAARSWSMLFGIRARSEEHTSELQYQIISYAVFCFKKKNAMSVLEWMVGCVIVLPSALRRKRSTGSSADSPRSYPRRLYAGADPAKQRRSPPTSQSRL